MLRLGICGTGNVARNNYLPYLARRKDVKLSVYNRTRARAETCAASLGAVVVDSPADLVAAAPDGVLVLTREMDRYEAAMALLDSGPRRLFFEKPLVARNGQAHVTEEDFFLGREMLDKAARVQCETAMVFNYRFFEQTRLARELAASRDFGQVVQVAGWAHYACWSHCIDLVAFLAGPVRTLTALEGGVERKGAGIAAPDVAAAFVCEAGATGTLVGLTGMDFRFPLFELGCNFENGRIVLRGLDGDMDVLDYRGNREQRIGLPRDKSRWDRYGASFEKSLSAWIDSIRDELPAPVPGVAGLRELQFEAALRRSVREKRPVVLDAEFPVRDPAG
ncbi:MAG: Gfo/Idh/MocA family oxidoreductase [Kiritimatiellaeota bacterium]|nr:Gfo/Idh/MocA family oxidoreductase [Kiritimatiellota bacterium]